MNAYRRFTITGFIAALSLAPFASAQCPASPLTTIAGTWEFTTDGFTVPTFHFLGSGGRFVASVGTDQAGNRIGVLAILQTSAIDNSITRLESAPGRYQMNDDCTGGSMTLNTGSRPVRLDFFIINSTEMYLVGNSNGDVVSGHARLGTPAACPAGGALSAIAGNWVFSIEDFDLVRNFPEFTAAGRLAINGATLTVTETADAFGGVVRQQGESGRAAVNDDCAGGYLSFSAAGRQIQFDYFFVDANRIILAGTTSGDIVIGEARRFGF